MNNKQKTEGIVCYYICQKVFIDNLRQQNYVDWWSPEMQNLKEKFLNYKETRDEQRRERYKEIKAEFKSRMAANKQQNKRDA